MGHGDRGVAFDNLAAFEWHVEKECRPANVVAARISFGCYSQHDLVMKGEIIVKTNHACRPVVRRVGIHALPGHCL